VFGWTYFDIIADSSLLADLAYSQL